jgi:exosortase A-associated hydrolase 2
LLFLHPFAEEMNKSRRTVALAAEAFALQGWLVLQIDFVGCGDSDGDFGDADWQAWLDDAARGRSWLLSECSGLVAVWALRAGSLVLADWVERDSISPPLLLWQPVLNGAQHLAQFLRLKSASQMLTSSGEKGVVARLRAELEAGRPVEVAGYEIAPRLSAGLSASMLRLPEGYSAPAFVLEVAPREPATLSPALATLTDAWTKSGVQVSSKVVQGPSFWQTVEIETAPQLIAASQQALASLL